MTNLQLLLSIGVPSFVVIAGWLQTNARLSRLESTTDAGLERLYKVMDQRFAQVDARFAHIESHLEQIDAHLRQIYHLTGRLVGRVDALEAR